MAHPLDGARLKIVRAQQHFDALNAELSSYLNSHPYKCLVQINADSIVVNEPVIREPPLSLGTILGDCVYNLMAPLDYIIWELAAKYAGRQLIPPPDGTDKPSFPIFNDKARFGKNTHRLTHYKIPAPVIDRIASVQPYNAGYESLSTLYHLINQDKHRLPVLTAATLKDGTFTLLIDGYDVISGACQMSMSLYALKHYGTVPAPDLSNVKVNAEVTVFVTLRDATVPFEPIDRTLEQIIKTVAGIVPRFDEFV